MSNQVMIPCLPCHSITETIAFYTALGFQITYQQERPNIYAAVKYEAIELHFFTLKGYKPDESYSTCLVIVPDVLAIHASFTANLRQHYAKLPTVGIPRITRPSNKNASGDFRFNVIDPGGNWIRIIQLDTANQLENPKGLTKWGRATHAASLLFHAKGDMEAAAKILDTALANPDPEASPLVHLQAWLLRAEIAPHLGDPTLAHQLLAQIAEIALSVEEQALITDEWQRMEELTEELV